MDRRFHGAFTAATTAAEAMGARGRHGWLVGGYDPYLPTYSLSLATAVETRVERKKLSSNQRVTPTFQIFS